jgi:hypothetical protein
VIGGSRERESKKNRFRRPPRPIPQGPLRVNGIWSAVGTFVSSNLSPLKGGKPSAF